MTTAALIADAVWTAGTRTTANGSPTTGTSIVDVRADAVWNAVTRTLTPPVNTVAPAITGHGYRGQLLTRSTGSYTNHPTTFATKWQTASADISGPYSDVSLATLSFYTLPSTGGEMWIRVGVLPSSPHAPAADYTYSTPLFVYPRAALPTPLKLGTLADTTAFNTQYITNEITNDATAEPCPDPLTLNLAEPVHSLDSSPIMICSDAGGTFAKSAVKVSNSFVVMGEHGGLSVGQAITFLYNGVRYTRTIAEVFNTGSIVVEAIAIGRLSSVLPEVPNMPLLADSSLVNALFLLTMEWDKHWNRLQVRNQLQDGNALSDTRQLVYLGTPVDNIENGDSGHWTVAVFLSGGVYRPAAVMPMQATSGSPSTVAYGPNLGYYRNIVNDVVSYFGESITLAEEGTDFNPALQSSAGRVPLGLGLGISL